MTKLMPTRVRGSPTLGLENSRPSIFTMATEKYTFVSMEGVTVVVIARIGKSTEKLFAKAD